MNRLTLIALTCALLLASACGDDDNVGENCFESPELPECVEACRENPTRPFCLDMSVPGDMPDSTDMGPCGDCGDQLCDTESGMCVDCLSNAECTTSEASACGTGGSCEACATDDDCDHDGLPGVCVAGEGCFECDEPDVESLDCTAEAPVCDETARSCRACAANEECAGGLCIDGACPDAADIVWVDKDDGACDNSGSGAPATPFCEIQAALDAGTAEYVAARDAGTNSYSPIEWTSGDAVTVVGVDAREDVRVFQNSAGLAAVRCTSESSMTLRNLTVAGRRDAEVTSGDGVFASNCTLTLTDVSVSGNGGAGVSATGGTVTLTDVSVSGNGQAGVSATGGTVTIRRSVAQENDGGGLYLDDVRFDVQNTVVGGRGPEANSETGVTIRNPTAGSVFANNTVASNVTSSGNAAGVDCNEGFAILNSILWNNMGGAGDVRMCDASSSSVDIDPNFDTDGYHLTASSDCCIDMADDSAAPDDDIDGQERPCGAGADIGADELCP